MNNKKTRYLLYRIKLEKLKQRTWALIIVARTLVFLVIVISYLRRS